MIKSSIHKLIIFAFILCLTILFSCENKSSSVILLRQAEQVIETNPSEALQLLDSIREPQNMDKNHYMDFIVFTLQAKYKIGIDLSADTLIFKAKDFYNQTKVPQKAALANFFAGAVYYDMKEPDKALISLFRAEDYARKANDDLLVGKCLYFSGTLFYEEDMMDSAICKYKQALVYFDRTKDTDLLKLKTITSIGRAFEAQGILDSAYHYFDKGLSQANNFQNKTYQTIFTHNLGIVFLGQKRYKEASQYMLSALEGTTNIQDSIRLNLNLSRVYYQTNQLDSAEYHKTFVLNRIDEINNPYTLTSIYSHLSDYYSQIGNDKQALYYKEQQRKTEAKIAQASQADKLIKAETNHKLYIQKQEQKAKRTQELLIQAIIILVIIAVYYFATTKRRNKYKQEKIRNQWLRAENRLLKQEYESHVYLESIYKEFILKWHQIENDLSKNGIEESPHVNNPLYYEIKPMIDDLKSKSNEQLVKMATKYFYSHNDSDIGDKAVRILTEQELMLLMLCYLEYSQAAIATILDIRLERLNLEERKERIRARLQKIGMDEQDIDFLLHS